jgi:hypothetical protein
MQGKRRPYALLVDPLISPVPKEISMEVPQKLKIELPCDPSTSLLWVITEGM